MQINKIWILNVTIVDTVNLTDDVGFGLFIGYTSNRNSIMECRINYGVTILKHAFEVRVMHVRTLSSFMFS